MTDTHTGRDTGVVDTSVFARRFLGRAGTRLAAA